MMICVLSDMPYKWPSHGLHKQGVAAVCGAEGRVKTPQGGASEGLIGVRNNHGTFSTRPGMEFLNEARFPAEQGRL